MVYSGLIADLQSTEAEKEKEAISEMSCATPYRWIRDIATYRNRLQSVVKYAQQTNHCWGLSLIMISSAKYRTKTRKKVLEACALLLRALKVVSLKNPLDLETMGASP